jgi:cofilin
LNEDKTSIVVSKTSSDTDYDSFLAVHLHYGVLYVTKRNFQRMIVVMPSMISITAKAMKGKEIRSVSTRTCPALWLFFVVNDNRWSPDSAPIKSKMVYASSKESIKRSFIGLGTEIQGTDYAEVSYDSVLDKVSKGRA